MDNTSQTASLSVASDTVLMHSLEKVHLQKLTIRLKFTSLTRHGLSDISFCSAS